MVLARLFVPVEHKPFPNGCNFGASMKIAWDGLVTSTLLACALITTSLVAYQQFFARQLPQAQKPIFVANWQTQLEKFRRLGPADAQVQLIEFADYECPYCASFHATLDALRKRYPRQVAVYLIHHPLPGHRFAEKAARAAECAGAQGHFEAMHASLFNHQNALGLKPWGELADEAGVPDLVLFESCIESAEPIRLLLEGKEFADQLGVRGTPTVIVNGWQLGQPPTAKELDRMVKLILAGKSPVSE